LLVVVTGKLNIYLLDSAGFRCIFRLNFSNGTRYNYIDRSDTDDRFPGKARKESAANV
jgi:TPP-dependent trihydroxycyclohexane-1,2-dione (THcHDO) dehydratase